MAPYPSPSAGEVKNNNQPATGASKVDGGWRESVDNHTSTMAGNDEQYEHAADVEGSDKGGKGGNGDGECGWQATKRGKVARAMASAMREVCHSNSTPYSSLSM